VKYAMIERDALVRLNDIRKTSSPTTRGHRRGMSTSSSVGGVVGPGLGGGGGGATKRRSNNSMASTSTMTVHANMSNKDRLSVVSDSSSSTTLGSSAPLSPTLKLSLAGRRPSRSAEPPEMVPERSEEAEIESLSDAIASQSPSSAKEEGSTTPPRPRVNTSDPSTPTMADSVGSPRSKESGQTPRKSRRQSLAPSEKSIRSTKASPIAHPGIIRLHSTFNDAASLCLFPS